jgi:hypothetical protein
VQNAEIDQCVGSQIEKFIDQLTLNYLVREVQGPFSTCVITLEFLLVKISFITFNNGYRINGFLSPGDLAFYTDKVFNEYLLECNATLVMSLNS